MVTLSASLGPAGRSTLCPLQPSPQPGSPRCRTELELLGCSAGPSLLPDQETGGCLEHPTHGAEPQPGTLSLGPAAGDPQPGTRSSPHAAFLTMGLALVPVPALGLQYSGKGGLWDRQTPTARHRAPGLWRSRKQERPLSPQRVTRARGCRAEPPLRKQRSPNLLPGKSNWKLSEDKKIMNK